MSCEYCSPADAGQMYFEGGTESVRTKVQLAKQFLRAVHVVTRKAVSALPTTVRTVSSLAIN